MATGSINDTACLVAVGLRGHFRSSIDIQMNRNNHKTDHPDIYCQRTAFERGCKAVILAIERDGVCHLIGLASSGRLTMINKLPNMADGREYPYSNYEIILSVAETDKEGEFILGEYCWIKKLTLKLK